MRALRHAARTLSDWQITDAEGKHTARIAGTRHEARARSQLSDRGGGRVLVTEPD